MSHGLSHGRVMTSVMMQKTIQSPGLGSSQAPELRAIENIAARH
jgi:hypothetical protein